MVAVSPSRCPPSTLAPWSHSPISQMRKLRREGEASPPHGQVVQNPNHPNPSGLWDPQWADRAPQSSFPTHLPGA